MKAALIFPLCLPAFAVQVKNRQLIPPGANAIPTTTSSYDYWWPYPPGGVTSTTTPSAIPPTIPVEISEMPPESTDSSSIASVAASSDDINNTTRSSSSSSSSSTSATPTSSVSMITISVPPSSQSALPSPVTYPKKQPSGNKISMYLIPVLVIIGAILGSLCAWIGWGCLTRKGRRGKTELEVGPAYDSEAGRVKADEGFAWPSMETQRQEKAFLVPPTDPRQTRSSRPSRANAPSARVSRMNTTTTMASASVYSQVGEGDEDYEEERHDDDGMSFLDAYESDEEFIASARRPSSRAIGGRPQRVVSRRRNHVRADSDMIAEGGGLGRSVTGKSTGGFRIVEESPLPTPAVAKTPSGGLGGFFWGDQPETDKYTALPSRGQRSRSRSPVKPSRTNTTANQNHPLPQSPRQIMSPKLEGSLCFTPSMGQETSGRSGSEYDDALSLRKVEDIVGKSRSQKNLRIGGGQ